MRNRIVPSCLLAFLLGMCLCGCTIAGKGSKCTLTVVTYYSGWGIDGQEKVLKYDTIEELGSTFVVYDGTNFRYRICFAK